MMIWEPARLLGELIALPSVNPAFSPPDDPRSGEARVAEFVLAAGRRAGLAGETQPVLPGRDNVLLTLSPAGRRRRRLLLAPHLDTVPAPDEDAFTPRVTEERMHGRGACDTKGSVAAMLCALFRVARQGARPRETEIVFAGLVDEESKQAGSRALAAQRFRADLAIVGEPTRDQVVTAHKGDLWLRLETRGKAAHGATPALGRNAVREMAAVVQLLEGKYAALLARRSHPLLGAPTINVGRIGGGSQPNIVPDACFIEVDRRTLPGETPAGVVREIQEQLRRAGLRARVADARGVDCPPLETPPQLPWVCQLMAAARQGAPRGVHYFCDAAVLAAGGIPAVVFGPGDIAQAHTAGEWISLRSLDRATRILERFFRSLP